MHIYQYPGGLNIGHVSTEFLDMPGNETIEIGERFVVQILLSGQKVFTINDQTIEMNSDETLGKPTIMVLSVRRPVQIRYTRTYGSPLRMVAISTNEDWFAQLRAISDKSSMPKQFFDDSGSEPFSMMLGTVSPEIARLATQLLLPPPEVDGLQVSLFRLSKAAEILRRIIGGMERENFESCATSAGGHDQRAEDIRLYILENLSSELTLQQIEVALCRHRRALQRDFKESFGIGIADFVRREKLKRANRSLQFDGVTIAKAAHEAGYANTASFSTAFRREFGIPPSQAKG